MEKIRLRGAPEPKGHYSSAVVHNDLIFVSGQLPRDSETGEVETGAIEAQTELALRNVEQILLEANSDLNHVLQMTIYISEMELWDKVNETYALVLGEHKPARAIIPVGRFRGDFLIEIEAIAAVKG